MRRRQHGETLKCITPPPGKRNDQKAGRNEHQTNVLTVYTNERLRKIVHTLAFARCFHFLACEGLLWQVQKKEQRGPPFRTVRRRVPQKRHICTQSPLPLHGKIRHVGGVAVGPFLARHTVCFSPCVLYSWQRFPGGFLLCVVFLKLSPRFSHDVS